jgi:hypothetical protein
MVFSAVSKIQGQYLKLCYNHILPYPFEFIIHSLIILPFAAYGVSTTDNFMNSPPSMDNSEY